MTESVSSSALPVDADGDGDEDVVMDALNFDSHGTWEWCIGPKNGWGWEWDWKWRWK